MDNTTVYNISDNATVCDADLPDKKSFLQNLPDTMFLICPPFIVSLNALVLLIAFKFVKLRSRLDQWFVVNMTGANLTYGLVYLAVGSAHADTLPRWACKPYYVITWAFTASSVIFLLLLNVNKFVTLFMPYYSPHLVSTRKTVVQIAVVWILVFGYCVISALYMEYDEYYPCHSCRVVPDPYLHTVMITVFSTLPLLLSLIISISIFGLAQKKSRYSPAGERADNNKRIVFKRIIFVFSYTVCNALTILPFRFAYSFRTFCGYHMEAQSDSYSSVEIYHAQYKETCWPRSLALAVPWLMALIPLVSAINPIITIGTQKAYRNGVTNLSTVVKQFFAKFGCCSKRSKRDHAIKMVTL